MDSQSPAWSSSPSSSSANTSSASKTARYSMTPSPTELGTQHKKLPVSCAKAWTKRIYEIFFIAESLLSANAIKLGSAPIWDAENSKISDECASTYKMPDPYCNLEAQECKASAFMMNEKVKSEKNPPAPGIEPGPPEWESGILTPRPCGTWRILYSNLL